MKMSHFQEKQKRQMTGVRLDEEVENQPKRRHEATGSRPPPPHPRRPASQQQRPASAIMASIMGDHHHQQSNRANSMTTGDDGRRSESATSGGATGRQHKLKQRFTVIKKLGKGTYGKVQLAINKETGQEVAIKTIKKTKIENEQDLERVRREIQIMSSIEHPHIVHIYEVFENKDKIVLIMQYAPGGELYEYVSQSKVLDEHEARRLFRQIATAIYYCHQNKICHRDLKLENILLDEKNNAKLADFGLSNVFDKSRQLKTFCGSPLYASPEIVQGSPYEGPEVDCWSLGVLLYTLVYGAMPFDGSNFKRLVKQISEASYYEPAKRSLASPLISKLLCADPTRRATVLDICSDPWVNGQFASAATTPTRVQQSPRLSPGSSGGSQHPSLLKVAQDMANLTPVRLDILLALTPRTTEAAQEPTSAHENAVDNQQASNKLAETNQRQIIQPARGEPAVDKREEEQQQQQVHARQEQEKAAMLSQLGSELMDHQAGDEIRSSSPVASYVVRELSPDTTTTNMTNATGSGEKEQELPSSREDKKQPTIEDEIEQLEAVTSLQPSAAASDQPDLKMSETEAPPVEDSQQPDVAQSEQADLNKSVEVTGPERNAPQPLEPVEVTGPDEFEQQSEETKVQNETRSTVDMEVESESQQPPPVTESVAKEAQEQVKSDDVEEKNVVHQTDSEKQANSEKKTEEKGEGDEKPAAVTAPAEGEEKPKKVKKRIVVVKKRRKVIKKDEAGNNQEAEPKEGEQTGDGAKSESDKKTTTTAKPTGPGKVRIPESFDQSAQSAPAQPKQTATRRPSALITDVSQKLMQQAEAGQTISSNAIEQDLAQLASVKVSDKTSEFERRTSLAAQQVATPSGTSPRDSTTPQVPGSVEPECCQAKCEPVKVVDHETLCVSTEPVERLEPIAFDQLQLVTRERDSEPLTPTNLKPPLLSLSERQDEETTKRLSECAERLSAGNNRTEGERSDSVETIKGEGDDGATEKSRNIRSSLQIDLSGAQAAAAATNCQSDSAATFQSGGGGSIAGPAPITRSYKKVTFTKDGTCITETGRIYSTQADDGTMRRVERKSKVTHYPSDSDSTTAATGSAAGTTREETTTHEEITYESSGGGRREPGEFWPRSSANPRAPLERLIMPCSSQAMYESEPNGSEEFMYARPSGQLSSSHFGQAPPMERADSVSSCSSGSTDVFDDIFDTWTGAISMFGHRRHHPHLSDLRNSLASRAFVTGSPLPFGQRQHSNLTRRDSGGSGGHERRRGHHNHYRPQSSSGANHPFFPSQQSPDCGSTRRQRCESVEPNSEQPPASAAGRQHRHRQRPPSADGASGYESDAPEDASKFERRSLGSARGRFGSSNLFPRHAPEFAQDPFAPLEDDLLAAGPGVGLFEQMALEHERLRRKLAQQRKQMWKGSTPAGLNEIPEFRPDPLAVGRQQQQQSLSSRSGSGSHWSTRSSERPQQQPVKRTSVVFQMGGGGGGSGGSGSSLSQLRQSTPLDAAPVRRNTANLAEHLPPQQQVSAGPQQLVRRSTSKNSMSITSQLANIQLSDQQQQQRSASFLGLKRNTSSSSSQPPAQTTFANSTSGQVAATSTLLQQQQQQPGSAVSSATATFWTDERATPTLGSDNTTTTRTTTGQRAHDLPEAQDAEANSRIQNWLLQSAGNLSISSGSKSSTSDATLPSSGRSDTAAAYLASPASSAAQMAALRRDESIRTTTTSSLSIDPTLNHHHQRTHSTQSRIILGQPPTGGGHNHQHPLPPVAPGRSQRDKSPMFAHPMASRGPPSSTIIVRSSSRQSLSSATEQPAAEQNHKVVREANEVTEETIISVDGAQQRQQAVRHVSSSAVISSQRMFAFPSDQESQQQQQQRVMESQHETVTSTRQQVFSQRAMSPVVTTMSVSGGPTTQESWFGVGGGQTQRMTEDDGFDSLGDLESVCSSSLLEQLRARGYRSMINQRMTPASDCAKHQTQQAATATTTTTTTSEQSNVVTTSSTSMTMSSSSETPQVRHHQIVQQQADVVTHVDQLVSRPPDGSTQVDALVVPAANNLQTPQQNLQEQPATINQSQVRDQNNNVSAAETKTNQAEEREEDQDEDVREAKANIREYLERMRETEKFLKSINEEEEKFQRQRQELILFDNLLLSAKLNGIKSSPLGPTSATIYHQTGYSALGGGGSGHPHSAPIQTNHVHTESFHSNGFMATGKTTATRNQEPQVSCFSSDLYRPMATNSFTTGLVGGGLAPTSGDPLEPVQPISMHAYATQPLGRQWQQRSKSQLGEQFTDYRSRRPVSARVLTGADTTGANVYFPSTAQRQRRSMSQVRYSHHHHNPSVLATSGMNQYHHTSAGGDQSPPSMTSEYRSSFGPPSLAPDRRHPRPSRSPRRATSPLPSVATHDESDDDNLGLGRGYRASSYVPRRFHGEVGVSSGRGIGPSHRAGRWQTKDTDRVDTTSPAVSPSRHRRNSVQATSYRAKYTTRASRDVGGDSDTPTESSPTRRKSWATSNDSSSSAAAASVGGQTTNSRLSELEQRIQANKKRREELLMGINSGAPPQAPSASAPATRKTSVSSDDDDLDHSFGFERPSRPAARVNGAENENGDQQQAAAAARTQPAAAATTTTRARPSRLESMEARIKRRSYCIKLNSPDRSARSRVSTSGSGAGNNKCQMEQKTDVER